MGKMIDVLVVRPGEKAVMEKVEATLEGYYGLIGCDCIQAVYPFEDEVALVCDDEGKFRQEPNRALLDGNGNIYDIVHGTFFICGLGEDDFDSLPEDLAVRYAAMFEKAERFYAVKGGIIRLVED